MKNIYTKISLLLFFFVLQLYLPARLNAQCTCADGLAATPVAQTVTIAPTASSNLTFTFNKFDPSVGILKCLTLKNTVSGTSYSGARNTNKGNYHIGAIEYVDSTDYLFSLSLLTKLGTVNPAYGINVNRTFNTVYGYDRLKDVDTIANIPGDSITYGPTNFITVPTTTVNINNPNSVYYGTGTFDIDLTVNGGMITLDGGANYKQSVTSIIGGTVDLTYYWCPAAVLANGLQNFTAFKKDNTILLKWDAQNAAEVDQFDIEYSVDGRSFTSVANVAANHNASASTYNYNYALNGNSTGYVYFRIKQTDNNNKSGYSAIQKILLNEKTTLGVSIHPNPVTTPGMSIAFDHTLNGVYAVELVNLAGQVVISRKLQVNNSNMIPVSWSSKPSPGIYITRITNTVSMEQQIVRVVVQ